MFLLNIICFFLKFIQNIKKNDKNYVRYKKMLSHLLSVEALSLCKKGNFIEAKKAACRSINLGGDVRTYRRSILIMLVPKLIKAYFSVM